MLSQRGSIAMPALGERSSRQGRPTYTSADEDALGGDGVIFRIAASGGDATSIASSAVLLPNPGGMAMDARGQLLVADYESDSVIRVNPSTGDLVHDRGRRRADGSVRRGPRGRRQALRDRIYPPPRTSTGLTLPRVGSRRSPPAPANGTPVSASPRRATAPSTSPTTARRCFAATLARVRSRRSPTPRDYSRRGRPHALSRRALSVRRRGRRSPYQPADQDRPSQQSDASPLSTVTQRFIDQVHAPRRRLFDLEHHRLECLHP